MGDRPEGRLADELVAITLRGGHEQWVLVHVEVQAQHDEALARRVLAYNYRIFEQFQRPVASLVVLADESPGWRPDSFHTHILGTEMGIRFATAKLLDFVGREKELGRSHNPFALVTQAHLRTQQTQHNPAERFAAKWQLTKLLLQHAWSKKRIIILFKVINWMMTLPEPLQLRYRRAVRQLERTSQMEWIDPYDQIRMNKAAEKAKKAEEKAGQRGFKLGREEGRAIGLAQGREEGREEGRQEGAAIVLERQLTHRFGPLPKTVKNKLAKASIEQLAAWSESILEAQSLRQVFK
ncbi:DUF4351 domain-containing protein [Pseudoduganella sp. DS3]|uniref:DUF4351 domain-containing protein n=1 Tax=Pseudoduganella guangdongensis TaxID=2692179 RepID=A0A6N9HDM0_9BURK|nr:DUF4351 domain-containing protein [Pseudoduganella guangdongensis]MYN01638.1 DUF4351 domain-containing protein [Pseudoduganella guangdongensis]